MNTCAAGALFTDRSKRGSSSSALHASASPCAAAAAARARAPSGRCRRLRSRCGRARLTSPVSRPVRATAAWRSRRRGAAAKVSGALHGAFTFVQPLVPAACRCSGASAARRARRSCCSTATESETPASVPSRTGGAERDDRAVDHRELAPGGSDDRLQPAGGRRASPGRAGAARRTGGRIGSCIACARGSLCAKAHTKAIPTENPITFRTWPVSSFCHSRCACVRPALAGKQAIT